MQGTDGIHEAHSAVDRRYRMGVMRKRREECLDSTVTTVEMVAYTGGNGGSVGQPRLLTTAVELMPIREGKESDCEGVARDGKMLTIVSVESVLDVLVLECSCAASSMLHATMLIDTRSLAR